MIMLFPGMNAKLDKQIIVLVDATLIAGIFIFLTVSSRNAGRRHCLS